MQAKSFEDGKRQLAKKSKHCLENLPSQNYKHCLHNLRPTILKLFAEHHLHEIETE